MIALMIIISVSKFTSQGTYIYGFQSLHPGPLACNVGSLSLSLYFSFANDEKEFLFYSIFAPFCAPFPTVYMFGFIDTCSVYFSNLASLELLLKPLTTWFQIFSISLQISIFQTQKRVLLDLIWMFNEGEGEDIWSWEIPEVFCGKTRSS